MKPKLLFLAFLSVSMLLAAEGIPRDLARERASLISDLFHYETAKWI